MCKCTFGKENMTLVNKLNITDSTELARMEEKISKKKAVELFENGYLTTKSIVNNGIPRIYLTKLVKNGVIERVSRGIYVKKDVLVDEFVILQSKSKYAIYSNTTALYLYGFSNRIPIKYDITVKNGYKGSLQKEDNVNLFYTK